MSEQALTYEDLGPRDQALIDEAGGGNQTVVSARMVKALNGNGNAAIMLSQLLFWSRQKADEDGWFYRTRKQMEKRCGLGKKAQKNAADTLSSLDLVESELRGMPAKKHYRVQLGEVITLLAGAEQDRAHGSNQDRTHGGEQDRAHGSRPIYRQENKEDIQSAHAHGEDLPPHAPSEQQVVEYGTSRAGMTEEECKKFWRHYSAIEWLDPHGRKITNWKLKLGNWDARQSKYTSSRDGSSRTSTGDGEPSRKTPELVNP